MPLWTKPTMIAAISKPVSGVMAVNGISDPFKPELNRGMYLTLSGTWTGSVQVERSTDEGQTWNPVTIGCGQPWLVFTSNCDEMFDQPTDAAALYRLNGKISNGTLLYRLAQ